MNKSTLRKQKAVLRKRKAKNMFLTPLPEPVRLPPVVKAASTPVTIPSQLSPQDELLWKEIQFITTQVQELLQRASAKIIARALLEGLKEAGTNSSVK
jgi:hypothetical protein